jgi:hypothetical protein
MPTQQKQNTPLDNPSLILPLVALLIGGSLACVTLVVGELWIFAVTQEQDPVTFYQRYAPELFVAGNALLYGLFALFALRRASVLWPCLLLVISSFAGANLLWGEHFYWSQNYGFTVATVINGGWLIAYLVRASRPKPGSEPFEHLDQNRHRVGLWTAIVGTVNIYFGVGALWLALPGIAAVVVGLFLYFSVAVRRLWRLHWLKQVAAGNIPGLNYQRSATPEIEKVPTLYLGELHYEARIEQASTNGDAFRTSAMNIIMRAPSELSEASRVVHKSLLFSLCVLPELWLATCPLCLLDRRVPVISTLFDLNGDGYAEIVSSDGAYLEVRMGSSLGFSWPVSLNAFLVLGGQKYLNDNFYVLDTKQGPTLLIRDPDQNKISAENTVQIRYEDRVISAGRPPQFSPNDISPKRSIDQGPQFENCELNHILVYDSYPEQKFYQFGEFEGDPCKQLFWAEIDGDTSKEVLVFVENTDHKADGLQIKSTENKPWTYYPQSTLSNRLRFNDLNGDGLMDATALSDGGVLNIYLQGQNGTITGRQIRLTSRAQVIDGDIDGDRDIDLLIVNENGTLRTLENNGAGAFSD